jgi:Trk K+ transport system NAD-binding subunit
LIDTDTQRAEWGVHEGIPTLIADATQDETLRRANIATAKGLVAAIGNDAENVYVTLSAHVLNPNLIITARATVALKKAAGTMMFNPDAKMKLEGGDVLIAIGERAQLKRISEELKVQATRA